MDLNLLHTLDLEVNPFKLGCQLRFCTVEQFHGLQFLVEEVYRWLSLQSLHSDSEKMFESSFEFLLGA
jgi:hypothetical protein